MMNAADFRELYDYHFMQNRRLWQHCITSLSAEQYRQPLSYSIGSIHNQMVHMMDVDNRWLKDFRGEAVGDIENPDDYPDPDSVRATWDKREADFRAYLAELRDEDLHRIVQIEIGSHEYLRFILWQGLIHVVNHGTDHRAQILAMLHALGVTGYAQDYASSFMEKV